MKAMNVLSEARQPPKNGLLDRVSLALGSVIATLQFSKVSKRVKKRAKQNRAELHHRRTIEATYGAGLVMIYARQNLALFNAMVSDGVPASDAEDEVARGNRVLFAPLFFFLRITKYFHGFTNQSRFERGLLLRQGWPFSAPSWSQQAPDGGSGPEVNYTSCPISTLMKAEDAVDLCTKALCGLDHDFSQALGLRLIRKETLVTGCKRCAFRWEPLP